MTANRVQNMDLWMMDDTRDDFHCIKRKKNLFKSFLEYLLTEERKSGLK